MSDGNGDNLFEERKYAQSGEHMTKRARSASMLPGKIPKYVDILQRVVQGCTLSPTLFKAFIEDSSSINSDERDHCRGRGGVEVVSDMFMDASVGISDIPEGLHKMNRERTEIHQEMESQKT